MCDLRGSSGQWSPRFPDPPLVLLMGWIHRRKSPTLEENTGLILVMPYIHNPSTIPFKRIRIRNWKHSNWTEYFAKWNYYFWLIGKEPVYLGKLMTFTSFPDYAWNITKFNPVNKLLDERHRIVCWWLILKYQEWSEINVFLDSFIYSILSKVLLYYKHGDWRRLQWQCLLR